MKLNFGDLKAADIAYRVKQLEGAREFIVGDSTRGLCSATSMNYGVYVNNKDWRSIKKLAPPVKEWYGAWWFPRNEEGQKKRLDILDTVIADLKQELAAIENNKTLISNSPFE